MSENDEGVDEFDTGTILGTKPLALEKLLTKEFPEDIWLVEGLVPLEGVTVISASPGSYKTWILLDIAISTASGRKLFGEFQAKQTGVLVIDEENGERLLQQRLIKLGADSDLPIRFLASRGFKISPDSVRQVIDYCKLYDIGLITFDSLVRIHNADENSAKEMAEVFRNIAMITKEGIAVLITHHNRKTSGGNLAQDMRGSSDILAALDCHLALTREENQLKLKQTKVRLAEELPTLELEVVDKDGLVKIHYVGSEVSESKRDLVHRLVKGLLKRDGGLNQRQLLGSLEGAGFKVNARTLRSVLEKMMAGGEVTKSKGGRNSTLYKLNEHPEDKKQDE